MNSKFKKVTVIRGIVDVIQPFLFVLTPLLNFLNINIFVLEADQVIGPSVLIVITVILFLLLFKFLTKDRNRAACLTSIFVIFIFYYGQMYRLAQDKNLLGGSLESRLGLTLVWTSFFLLVFVFLYRSKTGTIRLFSTYFLIVSIILFSFPFIVFLSLFPKRINDPLRDWKPPGIQTFGEYFEVPNRQVEQYTEHPDIYYIILDGYARQDVLNELYDFNNSEFLDFLLEQGFYVAEDSNSNYNQTALSLASSLNFEYLTQLSEIGKNSAIRSPLGEMIQHSKTRSILEQYGYKTIAFDTASKYSRIIDADLFIDRFIGLTDFEQTILTSSFCVVFENTLNDRIPFLTYATHQTRIKHNLEYLAKISDISGQKFIFFHIVMPHPPFIFDSQGNETDPDYAFRFDDGDSYPESQEDYISGYREQLIYTNHRISELVKIILSKSKVPPVIIIQGDHGPGAYLVWDSVEKTDLKERFGILNAYYFPGNNNEELYSSISPVNTFRVVFNQYFNANFPLLEDKSYFSSWIRPYEFIEITDRLNP